MSNFIKNIETCVNILKDHERKIKALNPLDTETFSLKTIIGFLYAYFLDLKRLSKRKDELKQIIKKSSSQGIGFDILRGIIISEVNKEIMEKFEIQEDILGWGSFGVVKKGLVSGKKEVLLAVKCIDIVKHKCNLSILTDETNCLEKLRHEHIVAFYGHKLGYDLYIKRTMIYLSLIHI